MRRHGDEGAAAVWATMLIALLVTMLLAGSLVVQVLAARSRAAAAADLAALAAAPSAAQASPTTCAVAAGVAEANGAEVRACTVGSGEVRLVVQVPWQGLLQRLLPLVGGSGGAEASARAGLR